MYTQQITDLKLNLNKKQLEAINKLIASLVPTKTIRTKHAPILNKAGDIVAKFCTRHQRYEPVEVFPKNTSSSDGLYSHCRYAEKVLKAKQHKISKLKNDYFASDEKAQAKIKSEIEKLQSTDVTFSDADYPADVLGVVKKLATAK